MALWHIAKTKRSYEWHPDNEIAQEVLQNLPPDIKTETETRANRTITKRTTEIETNTHHNQTQLKQGDSYRGKWYPFAGTWVVGIHGIQLASGETEALVITKKKPKLIEIEISHCEQADNITLGYPINQN